MAGCAIPTSSAGHAPAGAEANPKLTFQPDHLVGAGQAQLHTLFALANLVIAKKTLLAQDRV